MVEQVNLNQNSADREARELNGRISGKDRIIQIIFLRMNGFNMEANLEEALCKKIHTNFSKYIYPTSKFKINHSIDPGSTWLSVIVLWLYFSVGARVFGRGPEITESGATEHTQKLANLPTFAKTLSKKYIFQNQNLTELSNHRGSTSSKKMLNFNSKI